MPNGSVAIEPCRAGMTATLRRIPFHEDEGAETHGLQVERVVGSFLVDSCNPIQITIDRPGISASIDAHDVLGTYRSSAIG